jgi:hypothetical protein
MRVYEIGVGGHDSNAAGGSLPLWRDYFPRSTIVGLDINAKNVQFGPRVHFARADQNSPNDLERVVAKHGAPNIVIDDGSHIGEHIRTSFDVLWPALRPGGWYVVEDLATSYFSDFGGSNPPPAITGIGLVKAGVDAVESRDPIFSVYPDWGNAPALPRSDVAAVHCYPGIAFFQKAID